MPFSNVSKLPDPRVQTGAAPAYRAPPVPVGPLPPEVPNLRDFRSPAEEFARRARVPALPADAGARLRAMVPPDMSGVAERLAPRAAATAGGFGLGALARGAAALAGPVVGGAQMLMHSGELNSGEDAELARLRAQTPTLDPPPQGYADGGLMGRYDPYSVLREDEQGDPFSAVREGEFGAGLKRYDPSGLAREGEYGYANGGMLSGAEELEELRRDARAAQQLREYSPDMSEAEKRLGAPNGDRLRNGPSPQQFSPEEKIRLNPANAGPQRSLGGMPPPESVPSNTGRYAYSPASEGTARAAAPRVATAAGLGMGAGAAGLALGGAAATGIAANTVANNPEQFSTSIGDDGIAANIILASREGQAQRAAAANGKPTIQQVERQVAPASPNATPQQIERQAGFWQEPATQRATPFAAAAARPRPGRAAAPGGMPPQGGPDEAGFERLISDAQAGRPITTPRQRGGAMDLDAQAEAIRAEGRADLGPGGYIMANGTPYIDLAKGNADPEWRKRFDDRQARQNAISDQRPDANQMPVVIKDGNAYIGNSYAAPADTYWRGEAQGGLGRKAIEAYQNQLQKVQDTQFNEAINPGAREQGFKMDQLRETSRGHIGAAQVSAEGNVLGHAMSADAARGTAQQNQQNQLFNQAEKLRDDHKGLSKDFVQVRDAYARIKASIGKSTSSAPAALAGATSFMKLLDPGSVVRESELGLSLAATGVLDRLTNYKNTLMNGQVLTKSQAAEFANVAEMVYNAQAANQRQLDEQFVQRAQRYGIKPEDVVTDYYYRPTGQAQPGKAGARPAAAPTGAPAAAKPMIEVEHGGKRYKYDGQEFRLVGGN